MLLPRRGFCLCCLSVFAAGEIGSGSKRARAASHVIVDEIMTAAAETPITIRRLRGNVAVLTGSGAPSPSSRPQTVR